MELWVVLARWRWCERDGVASDRLRSYELRVARTEADLTRLSSLHDASRTSNSRLGELMSAAVDADVDVVSVSSQDVAQRLEIDPTMSRGWKRRIASIAGTQTGQGEQDIQVGSRLELDDPLRGDNRELDAFLVATYLESKTRRVNAQRRTVYR